MTAPSPPRSAADAVGALNLFAFFHLNLAFSSIEEDQRADVIARCYWPLLRLAERRGPIGIEASGFTLEEIEKRDPAWIETLRRLIAAGKAEYIGCGYSQMIGPLVPARVTAANLAIGGEIAERMIGVRPTVALVNEQAYAGGLIGLYLDAGYRAILMDWDNPASHHHWQSEARFRPQAARGPDGRKAGLLWTDTVAFQKLQRYVHGDIGLEDYLAFVRHLRGAGDRIVCIYASDAEIFDYRPGRYRTEEVFDASGGSEWAKIDAALAALAAEPNCRLQPPSALLASQSVNPLRLETPECPVPVKKQRKYNLSRWAVTGRDDTQLNAACERIFRGMVAKDASAADWKELCFLWASDFRTHITEKRWQAMRQRLTAMEARFAAPLPQPPQPSGDAISERHIEIATRSLRARLDRRRGLALTSVSFGAADLIGMLPLGTFDEIALQADWYTGNCVFEAPGEHKVTDLEWADARMWQEGEDVLVFGRIETPKGPIDKVMRFCGREPRIEFDLTFHWTEWGKGSLRIGHVTLKPGAFDEDRLTLTTHNGGALCESFALAGHEIEHGAPVSFLVSASHGLGMTEGWAEVGDACNRIRIEVDRAFAPLMGLLTHKRQRGGLFCQFALSALELDDTRKPNPLHSGPRRFRFSVNGRFSSATC